MHTASDSTRRSKYPTRWFSTCAIGHQGKSKRRRLLCYTERKSPNRQLGDFEIKYIALCTPRARRFARRKFDAFGVFRAFEHSSAFCEAPSNALCTPKASILRRAKRNSLGVRRTIYWASGEIRKTTTSFVCIRTKQTLRSRSAELIIAVNTTKAFGLSPALF